MIEKNLRHPTLWFDPSVLQSSDSAALACRGLGAVRSGSSCCSLVCDEGLDVIDAFFVHYTARQSNHGRLDSPAMLGASQKNFWESRAGAREVKNVGSSHPRGTILVLSVASDHADLVIVISSILFRQAQDSDQPQTIGETT